MSEASLFDLARDAAGIWDRARVAELAARIVPGELLCNSNEVLRADAHIEWLRWCAEGLVDPSRFVGIPTPYGRIFEEALRIIKNRYGGRAPGEWMTLASAIAKYVEWRVELIRVLSRGRNRQRPGLDLRRDLLGLAGSPPRCWITGRPFTKKAIAAFVADLDDRAEDQGEAGLPLFVDILRPIGLTARDETIEIDHVVPVAKGGVEIDNLRLACGWANASKRHYMSLYDVGGEVRRLVGVDVDGRLPCSLPQPFWIVRLFATRGRCEDPDGCDATAKDTELTVTLIERTGAPTPTNLRVVCAEHDTMSGERLVPRSLAARVWRHRGAEASPR